MPPDAPPEELLQALQADLLRTRSGPDGDSSAPQIWDRLRPDLAPLDPDPDLAAVDAAVDRIRQDWDAGRQVVGNRRFAALKRQIVRGMR